MLKEFAENYLAVTQCKLYEFILKHASEERSGQASPHWVRKGKPKQCFRNATNLVVMSHDLKYCEGLACSGKSGIPVHHAWAAHFETGEIIDPTWDDPESCTYLGVPFSKDELLEEICQSGVYGLLDTGRGLNMPLMQKYAEARKECT